MRLSPKSWRIPMRCLVVVLLTSLVLGVAAQAAEPKAPAATATGTLNASGTKYAMANALAYNKKLSGKTRTVVYLTEKPLDTAKLKKSFIEHGNDKDFFVFDPHVELIFDDKGALFQVVMYADGKTMNLIGDDTIKASAKIADGKVTGKGVTEKPVKAFDGTFEFDVTFDVAITTP
jgi:hypothetical protein